MSPSPIQKENFFRVTLQEPPRYINRAIVQDRGPLDLYKGNFKIDTVIDGEVIMFPGDFPSSSLFYRYKLWINPLGTLPVSIGQTKELGDELEEIKINFNQDGEPKKVLYSRGNKYSPPGTNGSKKLKGQIYTSTLPGGVKYNDIDPFFVKVHIDKNDSEKWVRLRDSFGQRGLSQKMRLSETLNIMRADVDILLQAVEQCLREIKS